MREIESFLLETTRTLKLDLDSEPYPEWHRLKAMFNFLCLFPSARIERSRIKNAYHLFADGVTSDIDIQRFLGDCAGRIYMAEKRKQLSGVPSDIIFEWKGLFEYVQTRKGLIKKWIKKPVAYETCTLKDVLNMPFCSQIDFHKKRRIKWWKRRMGGKKEEKRRAVQLHL